MSYLTRPRPSIYRVLEEARDGTPIHRALFRPASWIIERGKLENEQASFFAVTMRHKGTTLGYSVFADRPLTGADQAMPPVTCVLRLAMDLASALCAELAASSARVEASEDWQASPEEIAAEADHGC